MKVLSVNASISGFRKKAANGYKAQALIDTISGAPGGGELIAFPAGYFRGSWHDIRPHLMQISSALSGGNSWVLVGFDDGIVKRGRTSSNQLPFFLSALGPRGQILGPWRQISTTSLDADHGVPNLSEVPQRVFTASSATVLPLVCGEMHSPHVRAQISSVAPDLVVVCGHSSLGQGLVPTLRAVHASSSSPCVHVQHLAVRSVAKHHVVRRNGVHDTEQLRKTGGGHDWWLSAQWFNL